MRHSKRRYSKIDELPQQTGVYIIRGVRGTVSGRPNYVGKTKRNINKRQKEHERDGDDAVPIVPVLATVEFRKTNTDKQARCLEKRLHKEMKPYGGTGKHKSKGLWG